MPYRIHTCYRGMDDSIGPAEKVVYGGEKGKIEEYQFTGLPNPEESLITYVTLFLSPQPRGMEHIDDPPERRYSIEVRYTRPFSEEHFQGRFSPKGKSLDEGAQEIRKRLFSNSPRWLYFGKSPQELIEYLLTTDGRIRTDRRFRNTLRTAVSQGQEVYEQIMQAWLECSSRSHPDLQGEARYIALGELALFSIFADHEDSIIEPDENTMGVISNDDPLKFYLQPEKVGLVMNTFAKAVGLTAEEVYYKICNRSPPGTLGFLIFE